MGIASPGGGGGGAGGTGGGGGMKGGGGILNSPPGAVSDAVFEEKFEFDNFFFEER